MVVLRANGDRIRLTGSLKTHGKTSLTGAFFLKEKIITYFLAVSAALIKLVFLAAAVMVVLVNR